MMIAMIPMKKSKRPKIPRMIKSTPRTTRTVPAIGPATSRPLNQPVEAIALVVRARGGTAGSAEGR
jgi:hypothetical protein